MSRSKPPPSPGRRLCCMNSTSSASVKPRTSKPRLEAPKAQAKPSCRRNHEGSNCAGGCKDQCLRELERWRAALNWGAAHDGPRGCAWQAVSSGSASSSVAYLLTRDIEREMLAKTLSVGRPEAKSEACIWVNQEKRLQQAGSTLDYNLSRCRDTCTVQTRTAPP